MYEIVIKIGMSILPNLALGLAGYLTRAFDRSGFLMGVILGTLVTYAFGLGGFLVLLGFVALGSATTRVRFRRKLAQGISEPHGGTRTWANAVANLAVPAFGALAAIFNPMPVLKVFFTASVATAAFDTVASEMGKALAGKTLTLHDMKVREAGVPGGISLGGTISGVVAAAAVSLVAFRFHFVDPGMTAYVVLAALLAMVAESLLKSALGLRSTHVANLTNTLLGGLIATLFWTGLRTM